MTPAPVGITGSAVHIGGVGPVVVHPQIESPERRSEAFSRVAGPVVSWKTSWRCGIRTAVGSYLSRRLERRCYSFEGNKSARRSFEVGRDEQLLGRRQSRPVRRKVHLSEAL